MRIIDSHCHPQFPQYDEDRDLVVRAALSEGVGMICVGTDLQSSEAAIQLAEKYEGIWASVGLHPNDVGSEFSIRAFEDLARSSKKVVAIGEIGLDYYRTSNKEGQRKAFEAQLELAHLLALPVIVHCRDAHSDMRQIIEAPGVIHSFTGTKEEAQSYAEKGLFLGFNGILTFTDQYDAAALAAGLGHILLETDSPYLAPAPYRGKRNVPNNVTLIAEKLSRIYKEDVLTIIKHTKANTVNLFNIH